jgi:hypothetical protein
MKHLVEVPAAFREQLNRSRETGIGYHVVAVVLKNGKTFEQVATSEGCVIEVRGYEEIPFSAHEIESVKVNHKRWNFRDYASERKTKAARA